MKTQKKHLVQILVIASWSSLLTLATEHKAHVHGNAKISIAQESETELSILLDSPAESIVGFEHEAHTKKDKESLEQAIQKLRDTSSPIVQFDASLKCQLSVQSAGIEKEEGEESHAGHSKHQDIAATYKIKCEKSLKGSDISIRLIKLFPRVKKVSIEVLKSDGQFKTEVSHEQERIKL